LGFIDGLAKDELITKARFWLCTWSEITCGDKNTLIEDKVAIRLQQQLHQKLIEATTNYAYRLHHSVHLYLARTNSYSYHQLFEGFC
jgi:hypothetical protein